MRQMFYTLRVVASFQLSVSHQPIEVLCRTGWFICGTCVMCPPTHTLVVQWEGYYGLDLHRDLLLSALLRGSY